MGCDYFYDMTIRDCQIVEGIVGQISKEEITERKFKAELVNYALLY